MNSRQHPQHKLSSNKYYHIWKDMISRCYNPNCKAYKNYGGRGIQIIEDWKNSPHEFIKWCEEQNPTGSYTIERLDNDGPYAPDNCTFKSRAEQSRNRRTNINIEYNNEILIFKDFVEKYGVVNYECAKSRVYYLNWDPIEAVLTPYCKKSKKRL